MHFHYLLPENGGFVRMASTFDDHIRQLADVLSRPDEARAETARFVASFIRPHGLNVPCTPLVADAVEVLGARRRAAREADALVGAAVVARAVGRRRLCGRLEARDRPKGRQVAA